MNKKDIADIMIKSAEHMCVGNLIGYAFGAYVRDYIAEEDFDYIDIFLQGNDHLAACSEFYSLLGSNKITSLIGYTKHINHCAITSNIVIDAASNSVMSYAVHSSTDSAINHPFIYGADVDINQLMLVGKAKQIYLHNTLIPHYNEIDIRKNIKDKKYTCTADTPIDKIKQVESRGYSREGSIIVSVKASEPNCKKCNGTGIRDFGFYQRDCECKL